MKIGNDVAVMINGDDATFKTFYQYNNKVIIQPINPKYPKQEFTNKEVVELPIRVLGIAKYIICREV